MADKPMTDALIAEARQLIAAATPGQWALADTGDYLLVWVDDTDETIVARLPTSSTGDGDATLIAAAPRLLAALADALEAAQQQTDAAVTALDDLAGRLRNPGACPHVITGDDGISHCDLAETETARWREESERNYEQSIAECPGCEGSGDDLRDEHFTCPICRGSGELTANLILRLRLRAEVAEADSGALAEVMRRLLHHHSEDYTVAAAQVLNAHWAAVAARGGQP